MPIKFEFDKDQPEEEQIRVWLSRFQPHPRQQFYLRMKGAPWFSTKNQSTNGVLLAQPAFRWGAAMLIFLFVLIFFSTPSLRTSATQLLRFFMAAKENSRSIEVTYTPSMISELPLAEFVFSLTAEEAAVAVGFPLKFIQSLPTGMDFEGAAYDQERKAALIKYSGEGKTILFTQREAASAQEYASIGSNASTQIVWVRDVQGEFVTGGWVIHIKNIPQPTTRSQAIELIWDNEPSMHTLRWEENGFVYEIVALSPEYFSLDEILAIAESVR